MSNFWSNHLFKLGISGNVHYLLPPSQFMTHYQIIFNIVLWQKFSHGKKILNECIQNKAYQFISPTRTIRFRFDKCYSCKNTMYSKKRKRTIKLNEIRIKLISNPNAIFARIIVSKRASTFNEGDYNFLSGIYLNVISLSYNMQFIRSIRILYL